jgi:D-glycero-D-manno-heptose 1,7-bisphosphate phosphatase
VLEHVAEREPLGTGGALALARSRMDEACFVLNGDTLLDVDYQLVAEGLRDQDVSVVMVARRVPDTHRYARLIVENERVRSLTPGEAGPGLINGGVYALRRAALDGLPARPSSFEADVLPPLIAANQVSAVVTEGLFIDIGVPEDLRRAETLIAGWRRPPTP